MVGGGKRGRSGVVGNSLPRSRSLLSIQKKVVLNLTATFKMSSIKHFCGVNHPD